MEDNMMLSRTKNLFYGICIVILGILMNPHDCFAYIESSQIYPETVWISLDLPKEVRDKIDDILVESYTKRKNIWSNQDDRVAYAFNELSSDGDFNKINEIKKKSGEKIKELLSSEEKNKVEDKIEKCSQLAEETLLLMLGLDLSIKQQEIITHSLLEDQQQVACIVADKSFSWEERREKLKKRNVLRLISFTLDKEQLATVTEWDNSLINNKRNQFMVKK